MIVLPEENEAITVTKRVSYCIPGQKRQDMSVEYKYLSKDEFTTLIDEILLFENDSAFELLSQVVVDISGVQDHEGNEIAYTHDILKRIINILPAGRVLVSTFYEIHTDDGRKNAKAKN